MTEVLFPTILFLTSVLHLYSCLREKKKMRMISKPFLMPLLGICWVIFADRPSYLVLAGILLGGLGDIALLWPLKKGSFLLGVLFFFLGHLCYLTYIFKAYEISTSVFWMIFIALIYFSGSFFIYLKTRKEIPSALRIPSFMYMLALSSLSALSLLVLISAPDFRKAMSFLGASLFLVSDGILSQMIFVKKKESSMLNFIVMFTYISAQVLLAAGWAAG